MFKKAHHWIHPELVERSPHHHTVSLRSILMLLFHLYPVDPSVFSSVRLPSKFPDQNSVCVSHFPHAVCPFCLILLDSITVYKSKKSKAVPLHAMEAHGGRGGIAPTQS
jgi:hypothetical protein